MQAIKEQLQASIAVKQQLLADAATLETVTKVCEAIVETFRAGGKVLFCGNGGSAADAQHLSAELSGRYYFDRPPLHAEALHVNTSYLTAVGNDYGYDQVFSRLVQAQGRKGDVLIGISTSGNSKNVLAALEMANELGMVTVAMTGQGGGKMKGVARHVIRMPSTDTPRIQEGHITVGHIICEHVERVLFKVS
jgi:D-sedoheptulose 7-phosphate isomerase